jgi:hypothetical protein
MIEGYPDTLLTIIREMKDMGFSLYLKPHPRLGPTPGMLSFCDHVIPDYIPAEFINADNFVVVAGISSTSLAQLAKRHNNVYSIISLLPYSDSLKKAHYIETMNNNSGNRILYLRSVSELSNIK